MQNDDDIPKLCSHNPTCRGKIQVPDGVVIYPAQANCLLQPGDHLHIPYADALFAPQLISAVQSIWVCDVLADDMVMYTLDVAWSPPVGGDSILADLSPRMHVVSPCYFHEALIGQR